MVEEKITGDWIDSGIIGESNHGKRLDNVKIADEF
jgi:hypothetical protein